MIIGVILIGILFLGFACAIAGAYLNRSSQPLDSNEEKNVLSEEAIAWHNQQKWVN